jgi:hypothetical protein
VKSLEAAQSVIEAGAKRVTLRASAVREVLRRHEAVSRIDARRHRLALWRIEEMAGNLSRRATALMAVVREEREALEHRS